MENETKTVRQFDLAKDLQHCIQAYIFVFNGPPWDDQWTTESAHDYLIDLINRPGFIGFVGEAHGETFGYIIGNINRWWFSREFHINEMFVRPEYQRQGYGSFLLEKAREHLASLKISRIVLLTTRHSFAESFYIKNGFKTNQRMIMMSLNFMAGPEP